MTEGVMTHTAIGTWPAQQIGADTAIDVEEPPRNNPCAQCGAPIAVPDWVERRGARADYLWHCRSCGYRFESIAYFSNGARPGDQLAA
jgi:hypothetical protein